MTKGKKGTRGKRNPANGDEVLPSPKKECFGFFMDPVGGSKVCNSCPDLKECYGKWKKQGEPSKSTMKKVCPIKYEPRCKECEGI